MSKFGEGGQILFFPPPPPRGGGGGGGGVGGQKILFSCQKNFFPYFCLKNVQKNLDGGRGGGVKKIFYWSPAFRILHGLFAVIRKELVKTPTFRFFRDSQPLKRLLHTSSQMANFGQFWPKWAKREFFQTSDWNIFLTVKCPN